MELTDLKRISLMDNPTLTEKWLRYKISENPGLLGLGDLVLKDKERIQSSGGRLDLLLQDPDSF